MKAVVTGATGHLGVPLIRRLLEEGHTVRAGIFDDATCLDGLEVERVPIDVRDKDTLLAAFEGQDVVFHLAAFISIESSDEPLMRAVNVDGVRNAAEAALECGVRRMVHVSSVHAYDTHRLGRSLREEDTKAHDPGMPAYDRSKADGEIELRKVIDRGLNAVILNPVGVIGPFDHRPSYTGAALMMWYRWSMPIVPNGGFCWVDVRDVAEAALRAVDAGEVGHNHLLSSHYISVRDMHGLVRQVKGKRGPIALEVPIRWLSALVRFMRAFRISWLLPSSFTPDALYTLDTDLRVDTSRSRDALSFAPRPIAEAIADHFAWWREDGRIR